MGNNNGKDSANKTGGDKMNVKPDLKQLKEFINLMKKSDIEELYWEKEGVKIGFKRSDNLPKLREGDISGRKFQELASDEEGDTDKSNIELSNNNQDRYTTIKSQMVGTFYSAPAHDRHPYVNVGDYIDVGQKIGVIEAMKIMKEISSPVKGKVQKILIEDGHAVEYGQDIFVVEPISSVTQSTE